ncbi:MAG: hypothetical protein OEY29_09390 [Gammaproteobacteria bacterium]|nr:hypothetical protein [Gammaproteobacteria bacterium]
MTQKIIFVYNADSGLFNTVSDIAHKIFSPSTYECQLCAITHSAFSMREEWKMFLQSIHHQMEFLHRDEWQKQHPDQADELPAVYYGNDTLSLLISRREINQCKTIDELKQLIKERLPA